jgi:uncharacterized protein
MLFNLMPKETKFFDLFDKQAHLVVKASGIFKELTEKADYNDECMQKMKESEHECDDIAHEIIEKLNRTFITPFDREDIYSLAHEIDDVVDMLHTIINRLRVYQLNRVDKNLNAFTILIVDSINNLAKALNGLRNQANYGDIKKYCIEVHRLENEGDQLRDEVIKNLFDESKDPIFIMKWKEIYEESETVLDICEDVANVIGSILVKQG